MSICKQYLVNNILYLKCVLYFVTDTSFEGLSNSELDKVLQSFFAEVRDRNGNIYMKSTIIGLRYAINRHLQEAPWNMAIDLAKGKDFLVSNQVFTGMLKKT